MKTTKTHIFRVKPENELGKSIDNYCRENGVTSAVVTGIIGSFKTVDLAFLKELPGKYMTKTFPGPIEIAAAQGSIAIYDGQVISHIHVVISDEQKAVGGHLVQGIIFSTAEVVLQELDMKLCRKLNDYTGLKELTE